MKKTIFTIIYVMSISSVFGQEKLLDNPVITNKNYDSDKFNQWEIMSSAICFAKSKGYTPYDFGLYIGNLIAPSWNKENDFIENRNQSLYNFRSWRTIDNEAIFIVEDNNESFIAKIPIDGLKNHFIEKNNYGVSFDEMIQCMRGIEEQITEDIGGKFEMEIVEEWSPCITSYLTYAVIQISFNEL